MTVPLVVEAKLQVPRAHRQLIARRRLARLLEAASSRPLTVVCAPAGFGKTIALAQWADSTAAAVAWLSLDPRDDDPRRLLAHLLAALARLAPEATAAAERALRGGSDLFETVLPLTLDALVVVAEPSGVAVVLDDLHLVGDHDCRRLLGELVDALPPRARVIVASRTVPNLRLARRRAAGTVATIGSESLAFRPAEAERLLNGTLALALQPDQLAAVEERVGGWPVGVALIGASMPAAPDRGRFLQAFARSRSDVAEYLVEEILDQLDPELRRFLRRTAILGRLNEPLCAAVVGDPAAGDLLARARRSHLFVTIVDDVDPAGVWVRCHQLFAELLERELRAREPELVPALHLRAADWFEREGRIEDAIAHASAAGDGRAAGALVLRHGDALMQGRRYRSVVRLIDAIPPERGEYGPYCRALSLLAGGLDGLSPDEMAIGFRALRADYGAPGVEPLVERCLVSPFFGHVGESVERGRALLDRMWEQPLPARATVAANLGVVLWFAGENDAARLLLEAHVDAMVDRHRAWALATLALTALDAGDARGALAHADAAIAHVERDGGDSALEHALVHQAVAMVARAAGLRPLAERALARAARLTGRIPGSLNEALTLLVRAELELDGGERAAARASAAAARAIVDRHRDVGVLRPRLDALEAVLTRDHDELFGTPPTRAERRVLELLPSELSRSQIAASLFLTPDTVNSHMRRIYRRLGVRSRAAAVATARARGLLEALRAEAGDGAAAAPRTSPG